MKIVVIGGTGLIGSKTVERLRKKGHNVIAGAPSTGINTLTGDGVAQAVAGAKVVIDLSNSSAFDETSTIGFFETSGRNLLTAEKSARVGHHVALSVVGTERLAAGGYFKGKAVQEDLIRNSGIPYTIVHSTQFFEFMNKVAVVGMVGEITRVPTAYFQPISADEVADAMAAVALAAPANGTVEIAGPEKMRMNEVVARYLEATGDTRKVVADPHALYYGYELDDDTLLPAENAHIAATRFDDWLKQQLFQWAQPEGWRTARARV